MAFPSWIESKSKQEKHGQTALDLSSKASSPTNLIGHTFFGLKRLLSVCSANTRLSKRSWLSAPPSMFSLKRRSCLGVRLHADCFYLWSMRSIVNANKTRPSSEPCSRILGVLMMRESGIVPPQVVGTKTMIDPWASWPRWPVKWAAIDGETKPILSVEKFTKKTLVDLFTIVKLKRCLLLELEQWGAKADAKRTQKRQKSRT